MRILVVLMVFLCSCSVSEQQLTGNYEASSGNFFTKAGWYLEGKRSIVGGTVLHLNQDSTFYYRKCGCESFGNWKQLNDTIQLNTLCINYTNAKKVKYCNAPLYRLNEGNLFRIQYEKGKWVECMAKVD